MTTQDGGISEAITIYTVYDNQYRRGEINTSGTYIMYLVVLLWREFNASFMLGGAGRRSIIWPKQHPQLAFPLPGTSSHMNANAAPFVPRPRRQWSTRRPEPIASRTEKPLQWSDGPLVWIDCEVIILYLLAVITRTELRTKMTGLDYKKDHLLEIAVLITNGNLDIVDPNGLNYIIKTDKDILDNMDPWCVKQHGEVSHLQAKEYNISYTLLIYRRPLSVWSNSSLSRFSASFRICETRNSIIRQVLDS